VRQSITAAGPALVQLLDDQLRGVSRTPAVLPTELIIRESSLPPGVSNVTFLQHG
jgi:DNA-binding LacI/PurR family transcriptional regulator